MSGTIDSVDVQFFLESVWGTTGTGAVRLMGVTAAEITPQAEAKVIAQLRGGIGPGAMGVRTINGGDGKLAGTFTYEQGNYLLENFLGVVSPTGAGPYVRAGVAPLLTGSPLGRKLSYIKGDVDGVYALEGGLITDFTLKCEKGVDSETKYDTTWMGKDVVTGTLGSPADPTATPIMASDYVTYLDAIGGTPGATAIGVTVKSYELKVKADRSLSRGLGSRTAFDYGQRRYKSEDQQLTLALEFTAASKAFFDGIIGNTLFQRIVRLKAQSGTSIFQFDFAGQAMGAPKLYDDDDGIKVITMVLQGIESSGLGNWFKYSTTSGLATL